MSGKKDLGHRLSGLRIDPQARVKDKNSPLEEAIDLA